MLRKTLLVICGMMGLILCGCPRVVPDPAGFLSGCGADDPRVGQTATFKSYVHGITGTARIVDNCTIVIENFSYDGVGLDVRVVGYNGSKMTVLTSDMRRFYDNETLTVKLPEGVTLDDVPDISITCVSYNINFGDGTFQ